jgi:uncharacterized membrane protein YeiH
MSRELYAVPVTVGCLLYVVLLYLLPDQIDVAGLVCAVFIFTVWAVVIHWGLQVPDWAMARSKDG